MSQMELRSVPALKKEIIRLALAAAVQLLFVLWFYAFCCGLLSLGPLRLPYGVKGYEFGGMDGVEPQRGGGRGQKARTPGL